MFGTNDNEVASIQRRNGTDAESLGECHDGRINCPEGKIVVAAYELRDPHPIAGEHRLSCGTSNGPGWDSRSRRPAS